MIVAILRLGEGQPARTVLGRGVAKGNWPSARAPGNLASDRQGPEGRHSAKDILGLERSPGFPQPVDKFFLEGRLPGMFGLVCKSGTGPQPCGEGYGEATYPCCQEEGTPASLVHLDELAFSSRKSPRHASARPEEEPQDRRLLRSARSSHPCCYERCQGRGARGFPGDRPGSAEPVSFAFTPPGLGSVLLFPQR